ncbi:alpha/beta fold hydrolase [Streptomyces sp. M19]
MRPVPQRVSAAPAAGPGAARLRLLCFHHAGGTASSFAAWQRAFPPDVAVVPVQLPGREHRGAEPRYRDLAALVADLDDELSPLLELPYAVYGHSMGALIGHALADRRHRRARGHRSCWPWARRNRRTPRGRRRPCAAPRTPS